MARRYLSLERIVGAAVAGFVIAGVVAAFGAWVPNANGGYGAPFEVGWSQPIAWMSADRPTTFSSLIFALDVAVTATLFLLLARWSGALGIVFGSLAGLASFVLMIAMAASGLPFAGLPIPQVPSRTLPPSLVLWVDMIFWAGAVAALVRWRRRRTSAGPPREPRRAARFD